MTSYLVHLSYEIYGFRTHTVLETRGDLPIIGGRNVSNRNSHY